MALTGLRPDLIVRQVFRAAQPATVVSPMPAVLVGVQRQLVHRATAGDFVGGQDNGDYAFPDLMEGAAVEPETSADTLLRPRIYVSNQFGVADISDDATFEDLDNNGAVPKFTLAPGAEAVFEVASGTTGAYSATTGKLVDPNADFISRGIAAGDVVRTGGFLAFTVTALDSDDQLSVTRLSHGPSDARVRLGPKDAFNIRTLTYLGTLGAGFDGFAEEGTRVGHLVNLDGWDERVNTGGLTVAATASDRRALTATGKFASAYPGDIVVVRSDANERMPAFVVTAKTNDTATVANIPSLLSATAVAGASGYPTRYFEVVSIGLVATLPGATSVFDGGTFSAQDPDTLTRQFVDVGADFEAELVAAGDWIVVYAADSGHLANINVDNGAKTATRGTGSWITDGFEAGQKVVIASGETAANRQELEIATVTALVVTFADSPTLTTNADDDLFRMMSVAVQPQFIVQTVDAATVLTVADFAQGVIPAGQLGGPLRYTVRRTAAVSASSSANVSAIVTAERSIVWPTILTGDDVPVVGDFVFNDEGVLLFSVAKVSITTPTNIAIVNSAKTFTRGTGSWITAGYAVGLKLRIANSEDAANDGIYTVADVSATVLTVTETVTTTNADDDTITFQLITATDHAQAGVDLADDDLITGIGLAFRAADSAQYAVVRVTSATQIQVRHTVAGDEVGDTTVTGMTAEVVVPNVVTNAAYTVEKTLSGDALVGDVLVSYAGRRRDHIDELVEITPSTVTDVAGPAVPHNPVGLAGLRAVSNTGVPVFFVQVGDDTPTGWAAAIAFIRTDQVYNVAPLTQDEAVLALFRAHVETESAPVAGKRERLLWQSHRYSSQVTRVTLDPVTESAVLHVTSSLQTLVVTAETALGALGVRAGDVVVGTYSGYVPGAGYSSGAVETRIVGIVEAGNVATLTLLAQSTLPVTDSGGVLLSALVIKSKLLSNQQLRDTIGAYPATIRSRRVRNVYPDRELITFADETNPSDTTEGFYGGGTVTDYEIGGWYEGAVWAAVRSGLPASTPLTRRTAAGAQRLLNPFGQNVGDLDVVLDGGNFLLAQPGGDNAGVECVRAVTTDTTDLRYVEDAVTVQIDNFARKLRRQILPIQGSAILNESFFDLFSALSAAVINDVLRNNELKSVKLRSITQDPDRADTYLAVYAVEVFFGANHGDVTIYI